MNNIALCIMLLIMFMILIKIYYTISININDTSYYEKFKQFDLVKILLNNNKLSQPVDTKNKILFITYDNRDEPYIDIHNANINEYVNKWNYE